jgi:hypothetical protein
MGHGGRTSLVNRSPSAVVAGTAAKEPWWAADGATVGRNIADDVEGTMVVSNHVNLPP